MNQCNIDFNFLVNLWITIVNHSLVALIDMPRPIISWQDLIFAGEMCRVRDVPNKSTSLNGLLVFKNLDATYDLLLGKRGIKPVLIHWDRKGRSQLFIADL